MRALLPLPLLLLLGIAVAGPHLTDEPISPLITDPTLDPARIELGRRLFHDPRLSRDASISCAFCHDLARGGVDQRPVSVGIDGRQGPLNAPTVYNSAYNFVQFWDGRSKSLEGQVGEPIHNPVEMDSNWEQLLPRLAADPDYRRDFARYYPKEGLSATSVAHAIAEFERSLITTNAPFDRYLRGNWDAVDQRVLQGYRLFKSYGCSNCHQGRNVGGNLFQPMGVMRDYFAERGNPSNADLGRYNVTGDPRDLHTFKVPSLRLASLTPPYFHDGSQPDLDSAVRNMARYQLGRDLDADEVALIIEFIGSLVGQTLYGGD